LISPARVVIAAIAVVLVGCSTTTSGVATPTSEPSATAVNLALLDPGRYPTTPQAPLGNAGTEQAGRLVEGRRMAGYVVGPWQADAALSTRLASDVAVVENYHQLGTQVMWAPIMRGAWSLPFVVGFMSQRGTAPGVAPPKSLRNAVLRFADPGSASAAAQGFFDQAMHMPRTRDVTPIVTEPERAFPVPGHPEAKAALLTFLEANQNMQELTVATSHGPYVLIQVVRCAAGPDCQTQLAARTLDLQLPLIDMFKPTAPAQFATLPLDPTGLVARTLPLPADEATRTSGTYDVPGALHFEDDPVKIGPALTTAGVDNVSINRTTIYQAKTPGAAQKLLQDYGDAVAATPAAQTAAGVPGLPQSRCMRVPGAGGLVPHHWCLATAGRYMIKTVARQLDTAHQQAAAQYRILTG
jgi:hypothetical protein